MGIVQDNNEAFSRKLYILNCNMPDREMRPFKKYFSRKSKLL